MLELSLAGYDCCNIVPDSRTGVRMVDHKRLFGCTYDERELSLKIVYNFMYAGRRLTVCLDE